MHVFGSTATKLNLPNADVDVAIVNVEGALPHAGNDLEVYGCLQVGLCVPEVR